MSDPSLNIYSVLELFLRENMSSRYEPEELDILVREAKDIVHQRLEKPLQKAGEEAPSTRPRRPLYVRDADIEDRLKESLKRTVERREDKE